MAGILKKKYLCIFLVLALSSCSVISPEVRTQAEPRAPFPLLLKETERFMGKTVILGGYILEVKNLPMETVLTVLQTPLSIGDEPKPKDLSQGRFMVYHQGFLDPEKYRKDRKVTVAGTILGKVRGEVDQHPYWYLKIRSKEIYLWPESYNYPGPYYPYWWWEPYHPHFPYYHRYYYRYYWW